MFDKKKLFEVSIMLCIIVIMSTLVAWLLGYSGFLLIGEISLSPVIHNIIYAVLFYITFFIWIGISTNEYSSKLLMISIPYMIIYVLITPLFGGNLIASSLIPFLYILCLGLLRKDLKMTSIRGVKFFTIIIIYQIISLAIKTGLFFFDQNNYTIYQILVLSMDSIIFHTLLFLYGGELYKHEKLVERLSKLGTWSSMHRTFPREESSQEICFDNDEALLQVEFDSLTRTQQKFALFTYLGFYFIQCILVLGVINVVNYFFGANIIIESIIVMISFIAHGFVLKEKWHSKSIIICTLVSCVIFFIAAKLTPAFTLFQLFPIIIGLLVSYSMYQIAQIKKKRTFQKWKESIINLTIGKYSKVANHKEVALAKGLKERDLMLVGYDYNVSDTLSKFIGHISPWHDGKYVKQEDCEE